MDDHRLNENTKQFLLHALESPYGLAENEARASFSMADVVEWLQSEGIFNARPTFVRKFDDVVSPRRGEKGAERARYREYEKSEMVMLKVFLTLHGLGFSKKQIVRFWQHYKLLLKEIAELLPRGGLPNLSVPLAEQVKLDFSKPEVRQKVEQYTVRLHEVQRFQREVAERAAKLRHLAEAAPGLLNRFTEPFSFQMEAIEDAINVKDAKRSRAKRTFEIDRRPKFAEGKG